MYIPAYIRFNDMVDFLNELTSVCRHVLFDSQLMLPNSTQLHQVPHICVGELGQN